MDNLWAPWRMQYVRAPKKNTGETFLKKLEDGNDEENLVLFRGKHSFVCMNLYPYNNGHIMILPNNIVEKPEELDDVTQFEIMKIASLSMKIIREKMNAEGFNFVLILEHLLVLGLQSICIFTSFLDGKGIRILCL